MQEKKEPLALPPATLNTKSTQQPQTRCVWPKCCHPALEPIKIGGYDVWLGARRDIDYNDTVSKMDVILPLNGSLPDGIPFGSVLPIICCELPDRGGVPDSWENFIHHIANLIREGSRVLAYCVGGHGRTGTFGASLIAVMEPEVDDPIEEIRIRHCYEAVESRRQALAVFALKGIDSLPETYEEEFAPPKPYVQKSAAQSAITFEHGVTEWRLNRETGKYEEIPPETTYDDLEKQLLAEWSAKGYFADGGEEAHPVTEGPADDFGEDVPFV